MNSRHPSEGSPTMGASRFSSSRSISSTGWIKWEMRRGPDRDWGSIDFPFLLYWNATEKGDRGRTGTGELKTELLENFGDGKGDGGFTFFYMILLLELEQAWVWKVNDRDEGDQQRR